jgi:hypothetical protein
MNFRHELSYDAPPDEVFEMLAEQVHGAMDVEHGVGIAWLKGERG